jgi:hypothetical protein
MERSINRNAPSGCHGFRQARSTAGAVVNVSTQELLSTLGTMTSTGRSTAALNTSDVTAHQKAPHGAAHLNHIPASAGRGREPSPSPTNLLTPQRARAVSMHFRRVSGCADAG